MGDYKSDDKESMVHFKQKLKTDITLVDNDIKFHRRNIKVLIRKRKLLKAQLTIATKEIKTL